MIGDSSLVKKQKLEFEEKKVELSYSDITVIMNQCPLYDIVNVIGVFFNKSEEKSKLRNGKVLRIVKAKTKDQTGLITFTLFGEGKDTGYRHRVFDDVSKTLHLHQMILM